MKLSVVIAARSRPAAAVHCIESLRDCAQWGSFEVIVVNCAGPDAAAGLKQAGPGIIMVTADPQWPVPRQRDAGVRIAGGDVIAVLHERYRVSRDWVSAVLQAHAADVDVVGGVVYPSDRLSMAAWAMFFSEYSHMCPPLPSGILNPGDALLLPTGNTSYKRRVFAPVNLSAAFNDSDFHAGLLQAGARFFRATRMQVTFASSYRVGEYVSERFAVSRDYARERARHIGVGKRYAAAVMRLVLPGLVVARAARRVFAGRRYRARFLATLLWILLFGLVQMIGEMSGYLAPATSDSAGHR